MPKVINNITCVSYSELVGSGILTSSNYKLMVYRGKIKKVATGGNGREAQIDYKSLPFEIQKTVDKLCGTVNYAKGLFKQSVETNYKAREFFAHYVLADGRFLPFEIQEKYSKNAEVLDALIKITNNSKAFIKALGGNNKNLWANICSTCSDLSFELGHDLPKNERRLRLKAKEYKEKGFECLISGKFLNKNSAKVCDVEQEATIRELLRKHNNFDNVQVAELYNFFGEKMGWESISPSTIANYRTKFDLDTVAFRKGIKHFDNTKAMMVKRSAPVLPLVYWSADGWVVELLYQKTKDGVTTYGNRLTMVIVLDACGKYPIGYAIGEHENNALIRQAFRNAVKHTKELFGTMHRVGQLQTDNYGHGGLTSFYEAVTNKFTPAKIGNAKAKTVEPYNKYLNKTYCQLMPNWSGFGIQSKKDSQPNSEWINNHRHEIPTIEGVREQIERIMNIERSSKIEAYTKAYELLPQDERLLVSEEEFLLNLGETKERTNRLSHEGLVLQVNNNKKVYDCFDPMFRRNQHVDWSIRFDPEDMTKVIAVNSTGTLRFILEEKYVQPMALRDRKEGDAEELARLNEFNVAIKQKALDIAVSDDKILANVRNVIAASEEISLISEETEIYQKLLITDSLGQHKDRKNGVADKGKKLLAKQVDKELRNNLKTQAKERMEYLKGKVDVASYMVED